MSAKNAQRLFTAPVNAARAAINAVQSPVLMKPPISKSLLFRSASRLGNQDSYGSRARACQFRDTRNFRRYHSCNWLFNTSISAGDTSFQKIFMLLGPKRSGKGTIGRILRALLGEANVVSTRLKHMSTDFGQAPLIGKRLALISDARLGRTTDASAVAETLLNISGEDAVTINRKYMTHWSGELQVRFLMMTNELPRITNAAAALPSRYIILPMTKSFYGKEDPGLTNKLMKELPSILNWALVGLDRLLDRGRFDMPNSSKGIIQQFEDLASPINAFLRDWCVVEPGAECSVKELYQANRFWCVDQGLAPSSSTFGRDLKAALPYLKMKGRNPNRKYVGVSLSCEGEDEYDNAIEAAKYDRTSRGR